MSVSVLMLFGASLDFDAIMVDVIVHDKRVKVTLLAKHCAITQ
jgi:hypothetical protein